MSATRRPHVLGIPLNITCLFHKFVSGQDKIDKSPMPDKATLYYA